MIAKSIDKGKNWLRHHPNPKYQQLFVSLKKLRNSDLPTPEVYNRLCHMFFTVISGVGNEFLRLVLYTPAFKGRLENVGRNLFLYGGTPYISGPLCIQVGHNCRVSGQTTFSGRTLSSKPQLIIGNNVGIGWQTTIAVGNKIIIEDNVRIAGRSFLFGYSGHPINAKSRANGQPDTNDQVGNIHLKQDVWLGSNVTVAAGVTIGRGTIVATGSVVTKNLPDYVLAGGNPARVIRSILDQQ